MDRCSGARPFGKALCGQGARTLQQADRVLEAIDIDRSRSWRLVAKGEIRLFQPIGCRNRTPEPCKRPRFERSNALLLDTRERVGFGGRCLRNVQSEHKADTGIDDGGEDDSVDGHARSAEDELEGYGCRDEPADAGYDGLRPDFLQTRRPPMRLHIVEVVDVEPASRHREQRIGRVDQQPIRRHGLDLA
jgi:hypothetical protein